MSKFQPKALLKAILFFIPATIAFIIVLTILYLYPIICIVVAIACRCIYVLYDSYKD